MRLPIVTDGTRTSVLEPAPPPPAGFELRALPALHDARGRAYSYVRLSLTDRCDLACVYCMPPSGEPEHALRPELLTAEECARLAAVLHQLGVVRIRFTGGEPLVRRDVVELVRAVGATGLAMQMTTNGTRLAHLARPLRDAGLQGVNVSLDTLDAATFARLTRGGSLDAVIAGVHAALEAGLTVKLNAVVLRGENDEHASALVDWAWSLGVTPRFIELMPLGEGARLPRDAHVSSSELRARLGARLTVNAGTPDPGRGPARYLEASDGSGRRVGFISALSEHFCDDCNRLRVTARGELRACLASRRAVSLRELLRAGASDAELAWALHWALRTKDAGHHFTDARETEHERVGMSLIGG